MKIGHLSVASLHVLADFGFQGAVIRNLHNLPLEESAVGYSPRLKKAAEALRTAHREFDEAVSETGERSKAAVAKAIDRQRVRTWRDMRAFARASMAFPDKEVAEVARQVTQIFRTYGDVSREAETGRAGRLLNLTQDLRALGREALEKARMVPFLDKLEKENKAQDEAADLRSSVQGRRVKGLVRAKRVATDAAYHALVETVNALILVVGEEPYREFVTNLIGEIARTRFALATHRKALAKRRAAKRAASAEAET